MNFVGRSVTRLEDRPLVTGNGRFAADVSFAHQLHMRVVRSLPCPCPHPLDRYGRGTQRSGRRRDLDHGGCRRHSADRFSPHPHRRPRSLSPADPRHRSRALCRRACRRRLCHRSICRGGCRRPGDSRGRVATRADGGRCAARRLRRRPFDRGRLGPQGLRRRRCGIRERPRRRRARSENRPPQRRAAGDARRHRALRARHSRTARRRQGAALEPRRARPHARSRAVEHASATKAMSAAALACAAKSIRRMFWSASQRCGSAAR